MNGANNTMNKNKHQFNDYTFQTIGLVHSEQVEPYQAARQPDQLSKPCRIYLNTNIPNIKQGLNQLSDCSHIWLIYVFHHNTTHWKPLVHPPRVDSKIGVFATRAPYRPNPIGMTVVKLLNVGDGWIDVDNNDLLDETPILDIKPYHPESDLITDAEIKWLTTHIGTKYMVQFSPFAESQLDFLESHGFSDLRTFCLRQLEYNPTNKDLKRVHILNDTANIYSLAYRTWRIDFILTDTTVSVIAVRSSYSDEDLSQSTDTYEDKNLHRLFNKEFC